MRRTAAVLLAVALCVAGVALVVWMLRVVFDTANALEARLLGVVVLLMCARNVSESRRR